MFSSFNTALSGLSGNGVAVDVIGNNLANLNTPGYKTTVASFYDLMSQSMGGGAGSNQVGIGIGKTLTSRQFTQGSVKNTSGIMDAAIQGNGFFTVKNSAGQTLYTRAGNFQLNLDGKLMTSTGQAVQGWTAVNGVVNTTGATGDITLPLGAVQPATATGKITASANLDASAAAKGTFSTPIEVVDSLGGKHVLTITYTKTDANKWKYDVSIPGADVTAGKAATPFAIEGATGDLTFNTNGQLETPAATDKAISLKITGLANGAADLNVDWSLYDASGVSTLTQLSQASATTGTTQDGITAGQITSLGMSDGGKIIAHYSNGQDTILGQLALATIRNPESMVAVGENNLAATADTSPAVIAASDTGAAGKIVGGALENSTVDIATEFTSLIVAQRSYQANARVITATDELSQDLLSLIR